MSDGSVKIGVELEADKLKQQIKAQETVVKGLGAAAEAAGRKLAEATNKQDKTGASLSAAKNKQAELKQKIDEATAAYKKQVEATGDNSEAAIEMGLAIADLEAKYEKAGASVERLQERYDRQGNAVEKAKIGVDKANAAYQQAQQVQENLQKALEETNQKLHKQTGAWETAMRSAKDAGEKQVAAGKALSVAFTAPVVAAGTYAAKAAIDFESAFAGVEKTVDATEAELESFKTQLIDLSNQKPQTASQLAGIAEAAGQLGVSNDYLMKFTDTVSDLQEATNLGEDAASSLAQFKNITGMMESEYENFGSAVVELGNNFATTEADIVSMAMGLAAAGTQVGLSEADILGFATALSSVGIEAQAGGSAFSRIMKQMSLASETGANGLEDFAKVAGMSAKDFQKAFKTDAAKAIQAFIVGLSKMDEHGISAIKTLDDMGITELRLSDTLLRATNAAGTFSDALDSANKGWNENTALTNEAEKRYATFASRMQIVRNQITSIAMTMGEEFVMPSLEGAMDQINNLIGWFNQLDDAQRDTLKNVAVGVAAIGPSLMGIGKANEIIGTVTDKFGLLKGACEAAGGGIRGLASAASTLLGPAGIIAVGIGAVALLVKGIQTLSDNADTASNAIKKAFDSVDQDAVKMRSERYANIEIKTKTTVTEEGPTAQTKLDEIYQPIIDQLEAGKTVTTEMAVLVNQATVNFVDGLIEGVEADAQSKIDSLTNSLNLGEIDTSEYQRQVAQIRADADATKQSLEAMKSSATASVTAMVGDASLTVDGVKSGFEAIKTEAQSGLDYINSIPGQIEVAGLFSLIQTSLTDKKPDDKDWLLSQVTTVFDGQVEMVNNYIEAEIKKLDVNAPDYDNAKQALVDKGAGMVEQLEGLRAEATTFIEQMAGQATSTVNANMGELDSIEARAREVLKTINEAVNANSDLHSAKADLVKAGAVKDTYTIDSTIKFTRENFDAQLRAAEEQGAKDVQEALDAYKNGAITQEEYSRREQESNANVEAQKAALEDAYRRELGELVAGITKSTSPELEQKLREGLGKIDTADAISGLIESLKNGTANASDFTSEMAKAMGLDEEQFQHFYEQINEAIAHPEAAGGISKALQFYADQLKDEGANAFKGIDLTEMTEFLTMAMESGVFEGLEGFDAFKDMSPEDLARLLLGDFGQEEDPLPLSFPVEGEAEVTNKDEVSDDVADQTQEAVEQATDGKPTEVTQEVKVNTEINDDGTEDLAEDLGGTVEDAVKDESVDIKLSANVTMDEQADSSVKAAGAALAKALADAIKDGGDQVSSGLKTALGNAAITGMNEQSSFISVGKYMCEGVAQGIRDGTSSITGAIQAAASAAVTAFNNAMVIKSPSRVMAKSGRYVAEGIAVGIKQGEPSIVDAINNVASTIISTSATNAEQIKQSRIAAIREELRAVEAELDAYQKMIDEKDREAEKKELEKAVKKAKNAKKRLAAQQELNAFMLEAQKEALEAEIKAYEDQVGTLVSHYDFMGDQIIVALKNRYEQERDLQLERLEAEYDAAVEAADKMFEYQKSQSESYLEMLEAEKNAEVDLLQARIDALDAEAKAEKDAERAASDAKKLAELQAAVDRAKNAKFRAEAQEKLDEELAKQAKEARERERKAEIESLKQQIDDAEEQYDKERELEERRIDAIEEEYKARTDIMKSNYEEQKKVYEKHYDELLSAERLNAEARRLLLEDSNDEMMELLESYNPEWFNAGKSFGELFVEALGVEMDNVHRLLEEASAFADNRLDEISRKVAEITGTSTIDIPATGGLVNAPNASNILSAYANRAGNQITQNISFNRPEESPAETARALRTASEELAYGI